LASGSIDLADAVRRMRHLSGLTQPQFARHRGISVQALRRHASDPLAETIEFLRRDVLNLALRNTDNHARNHAVQRLDDGRIQLTPLYDFAPMFLDPELIPRAVHWADAADVRLHDWAAILPALRLPVDEEHAIVAALTAFADTVGALPARMRDAGVDAPVIAACRASIDTQAEQLARLRPHA
jgi:serine/threonine-protein kinase HipA